MRSALPLGLLGAAFLAGIAALVIRGPEPIPEDNGISGGIVIFLSILLLIATLYLGSFGVVCTFISTRATAPWLRRVLDTSAALLSLPLAVFVHSSISPGIREASLLWLALPCAIGFVVGTIYAVVRRLALP